MGKIILALESSCDETAAAVICAGKLMGHAVASQQVHATYGGVVPELAARVHQQNIIPIVTQALQEADIQRIEVQVVAFTQGPGLLGSLLVGTSFAKGLALALQVPLVAVHHIKAHILANFIEDPKPCFPFLGLVVSGGHTQLILVKDYLDMELLGQTQDDAIGEAFDKIAKMMGFPYPGGAWIDKYATMGDPTKFAFPTTTMPHLDFSFSGIKTAFLYFLKKQGAKMPIFLQKYRNDLCASIQATLVQMVVEKVQAAVAYTGVQQVVLGGGVAANSGLRHRLKVVGQKQGWELFVPAPKYCTDNAAMIGIAAYYQVQVGDFCSGKVESLSRIPL